MPGTRKIERAASRAPTDVKDAFAAWLTQLDGDDAAHKVLATLQPGSRHRSRAERAAQLEHAQQSTAASALKRSAIAVAVDAGGFTGVAQESNNAVRLPAIEIDKAAALQRRRQALADQASYAALNNYSQGLAPGLALLVSLADAAAASSPPFRAVGSAELDADTTPATEDIRVRDYELANFPVRIVPTLLRVRSQPKSLNRRNENTAQERGWTMALLLCRDPSELDDEKALPTVVRSHVKSSRTPGTSFKPMEKVASSLTLLVRLYMSPPQSRHRNPGSLSSETRRGLVRTLLSSWVSATSAGWYGGGVRAVCKRLVLTRDQAACRPSGTASRLLWTTEEIENAVDTLCGDSADLWNSPSSIGAFDGKGNIRDAKLGTSTRGVAQDTYSEIVDAIQPYIPSRSSLHASSSSSFNSSGGVFAPERSAWIARCSFRKKEKNPSTIWILSGGGHSANTADGSDSASAVTVNEQSSSCQIVKCSSSQSWIEPRLLAAGLTPELERVLCVSFKELVADFVQCADGSWLLLQVKAFELRHQSRASGLSFSIDTAATRRTKSAPDRLTAAAAYSAQRYRKWRCAGRYCYSSSSTEEVSPVPEESVIEASGYLSLKILRSCEFLDDYYCRQDASLGGGFGSFIPALTFHLQHELPRREMRQLYESQPLCSACMRRYYQLHDQLDHTMAQVSKTDRAGARAGRKPLARAARNVASTGVLDRTHPRVLPPLQPDAVAAADAHSIYSSISAPELALPQQEQKKSSTQELDQKQRSYLDEIAAMEKVLAIPLNSDAPRAQTQRSEGGGIPDCEATASGSDGRISQAPGGEQVSTDVYTRIFSPEGQRRRVEAMWQSVAPKALVLDRPEQPQGMRDSSKQMYNTFSLASELRQLDEEAGQSCGTQPNAVDVKSTPTEAGQSTLPPIITVGGSQKARHIRITDCRRIFSDDEYRDQVVQEAVDAITDRGERVCFIVMPSQSDETDPKLSDVALRSLHLDVKESVARYSVSSKVAVAPQILHEASGCVTMTI